MCIDLFLYLDWLVKRKTRNCVCVCACVGACLRNSKWRTISQANNLSWSCRCCL